VSRRTRLLSAWTLAVLGIASIEVTKIALVLTVLVMIAFAALPKERTRDRRLAFWLLVVATVTASVGFVRFTIYQAVPSLVAAGNNAAAQSAISRLRELSFQEDKVRELAFVDPDGDKVGSAALIVEMSGHSPVRKGNRLDPPLLNRTYSRVDETKIGPAVLVAGYYYIVCLPKLGGGFTARPGEAVDEELAERRFVAYAWPVAENHGAQGAFFIDEHENILVSDNRANGETRYAGPNFPPPCDAAIAEATRYDWYVWRGKKPRDRLPYDR
jgi:hypothetical protein